MIAALPIAHRAVTHYERDYWSSEPGTPICVGPCWRLSARVVDCTVKIYGVFAEAEVEGRWVPSPAFWLPYTDTATLTVAGKLEVH